MMNMDSNAEITFTATNCYINKELLYKLAYAICDPDGYEYDYTIFGLARDPSIIQKIMEAAW